MSLNNKCIYKGDKIGVNTLLACNDIIAVSATPVVPASVFKNI